MNSYWKLCCVCRKEFLGPQDAEDICDQCRETSNVSVGRCSLCGGSGILTNADGATRAIYHLPDHGPVICPECEGIGTVRAKEHVMR